MPLPPEQRPATHHLEQNLLAPLLYPAMPDGQTQLFEVERAGELVFSVAAVVMFQIRGERSVDIPDTPVEGIVLYDRDTYETGNRKPILKIEPDADQTTIAESLSAGVDILIGKIGARWDAEHADMHSSESAAPDHSELSGSFGDSGDWIVQRDT